RHERLIFLFNGKRSLKICRETFQDWPRRFGSTSRLEPADDHESVAPAVGQRSLTRASPITNNFVVNAEREPGFPRKHALRPSKPFRHDAHDGKGAAIDQERPPR